MLKIELPIYYTINYKTKKDKTFLVGMNWYRNAFFHESNKVKQYYHDLIKNQLSGEKLGEISPEYHIYVKNPISDGPNIRSLIEKFTLDALQEFGYLENDNIKYLKSDKSYYHIDKENPRAIVIIE